MRDNTLLMLVIGGMALGLSLLSAAGGHAEEPIKPIPQSIDVDPRKVDLGRLNLPHGIGPPLGYGKRRTDDGKEALQA